MPESRKKRTEKFLVSCEIPINPYLPVIVSDSEARIKSPEEIMKRVLCAYFTAQVGCDAGQGEDIRRSADFFMGFLKRFRIENDLTEDEKLFFEYDGSAEISMQKITDITWRLEMCMPLFWACGFLEGDLAYPDEPNDLSFIVPVIKECTCFEDIMKRVKMKSVSDILDNADAIYHMDWACVDARIKGMPAPADLDPEVVAEQHKGFNWLINTYGSENWDSITADT